MEPELGKLENLNVRKAWKHEAHNFTPWLLSNEHHLAEVLGIDLELNQAEHAIGSFSLDLIGRDLSNAAVLIVENQLDGTDHSHLGQLLTYASGTEAQTIVWIATSFREEHRQALDWLNENTRLSVRFFGVKLGLVKIGDSQPAPLLTLIAKPNDWHKQVKAATSGAAVNSKTPLYQSFWVKYLDEVHLRHPHWTASTTPSNYSTMMSTGPLPNVYFNFGYSQGSKLRHELYITTSDKVVNKQIFDALCSQKEEFELEYGSMLSWDRLPDNVVSKITAYRDDGEVSDTHKHAEDVEWLIDQGERMRKALDSVTLPKL